jgi:hypothetical protein
MGTIYQFYSDDWTTKENCDKACILVLNFTIQYVSVNHSAFASVIKAKYDSEQTENINSLNNILHFIQLNWWRIP